MGSDSKMAPYLYPTPKAVAITNKYQYVTMSYSWMVKPKEHMSLKFEDPIQTFLKAPTRQPVGTDGHKKVKRELTWSSCLCSLLWMILWK